MSLGQQMPMNISPSTMDPRFKETLDAWLKFGTAYLVYRLGMYYFVEPNGELFDSYSLQIIFYILIGFTIYYMFIKPYIPVTFEHPILRNVGNDTLMFGTVLLTSHLLDVIMGGADLFNRDWFVSSGIILVAFAAYQVFLHPFVPTDKLSPQLKPIADDWLQFGAFLIIARILQGRSLTDQSWIMSVLFALLGFAGYELVTKKLITP